MASYVCGACEKAFEADEARCPKCLKKSTVREAAAEVSEIEALAASEEEPSARPGLLLGLIGLSFVISLALLAMLLSFDHTLEVTRARYPAMIGLFFGSIVSLRMAPRFAVDDARPMFTYFVWIAIAAAVGTSVMIAGTIAVWMLADDSIVLTVVVAVVLWLAVALPAFSYGLKLLAVREKGAEGRTPAIKGKWR